MTSTPTVGALSAVRLPPWWFLISWVAMIAYSVGRGDEDTRVRVAVGALMVIAAVAVQFTTPRSPAATCAPAVVIATAAGLTVIILNGNALGYVPVLVVAARFPYEGRIALAWLVADTIAFGAAVAITASDLTAAIAGIAIPVLIQRVVQRRQIILERDRAQALLAEVEAGRDAQEQEAALRERGRIARDLHDVLAHSLAGLSLQLQAIRAVAARSGAGPELTEPIDKAAALARDGLAEAREAVSTLRDPVGLGLDALPTLVTRHPGFAGLDVVGDPGSVSAGTGHAVYRAVQEALTNAARYAPSSEVRVTVDWQPHVLAVRVDDTGAAPGHPAVAGQGTGLGLAGLDERIRQVGGSVHAGPRPDGAGWRVELTVPRERA